MKRLTFLLAALATLLSLSAVATPADAHSRFRGGVVLQFGAPWPGWWGPRYYYPPPVYYYDDDYYPPPAIYVERPAPPTYIERSDVDQSAAPAPETNWWYWCPNSQKYYPYVKECPGGFHRVAPQVPPAGK